jgi:hypothetical protein
VQSHIVDDSAIGQLGEKICLCHKGSITGNGRCLYPIPSARNRQCGLDDVRCPLI